MKRCPLLPHTPEPCPDTAPGCETTGSKGGTRCQSCHTILTEPTVIPANGHTWDKGVVTKQSDCQVNGTERFTCTVCGKTRTDSLPLGSHTPEDYGNIEPTCTTRGMKGGTRCKVCRKILTEPKTVGALGHDWNSGVVVHKSTRTRHGEKVYACTRCHETRSEQLALNSLVSAKGDTKDNPLSAGNSVQIAYKDGIFKLRLKTVYRGDAAYVLARAENPYRNAAPQDGYEWRFYEFELSYEQSISGEKELYYGRQIIDYNELFDADGVPLTVSGPYGLAVLGKRFREFDVNRAGMLLNAGKTTTAVFGIPVKKDAGNLILKVNDRTGDLWLSLTCSKTITLKSSVRDQTVYQLLADRVRKKGTYDRDAATYRLKLEDSTTGTYTLAYKPDADELTIICVSSSGDTTSAVRLYESSELSRFTETSEQSTYAYALYADFDTRYVTDNSPIDVVYTDRTITSSWDSWLINQAENIVPLTLYNLVHSLSGLLNEFGARYAEIGYESYGKTPADPNNYFVNDDYQKTTLLLP